MNAQLNKPKPTSIKEILKDVLFEWERKGQLGWEKILAEWPNIVGKRAALHTSPASLKDGCLVVNVDTSPWLFELTLKKGAILEEIIRRFDVGQIRELRFKRKAA